MPAQTPTEWATIGRIVAPFGIRGDLKIFPLTDVPDRFTQLEAVYLTPDYTRYAIEGVRPYKGDLLLLKLRLVNDANTAETLRNRDICIPLEQLAILPPNSYYQHDILGLQVLTLDQHLVGSIVDIIQTGSNDVYVIKTAHGNQILIPAIKDIIKQIDLPRRVMYIDPIKGLLDDTEAIIDDPNKPEEEEG